MVNLYMQNKYGKQQTLTVKYMELLPALKNKTKYRCHNAIYWLLVAYLNEIGDFSNISNNQLFGFG
jgi:hypothetical protein